MLELVAIVGLLVFAHRLQRLPLANCEKLGLRYSTEQVSREQRPRHVDTCDRFELGNVVRRHVRIVRIVPAMRSLD